LILFIEKVAFDSHSLIAHEHGDGHGHAHGDQGHNEPQDSLKKPLTQEIKNNDIENQNKVNNEDDDSDEEEEAIKNVVSSKGKFASFLQQRNILTGTGSMVKTDKALLRASQIVSKTLNRDQRNEDMDLLVNPQNTELNQQRKGSVKKEDHVEFIPASNITPYLLLVALSFHGFFEGMALGLQGGPLDTFFLFIAIISHKWAEAFTLGISFHKAQTDKQTFIRLIILFSMFTPIGILIGLVLAGGSMLIEGIFLAMSTGTFIYVACSEVIVEEFAITKYKYSKFFAYMVGGIFIAGLALVEKFGMGE